MKKRRAAKKASPLLSVLIVVFCLLVFFGISLAYDIGVIRRTVSTWRTASEKAKVSR